MKRFDLRRLPVDVQFMGFCGGFRVVRNQHAKCMSVDIRKIFKKFILMIRHHDLHHCIDHHFVLIIFWGGVLPNLMQSQELHFLSDLWPPQYD